MRIVIIGARAEVKMEISFGFNEDLVTELQPVNGSNFNEASSASSSNRKPPTDIYGGGSAGQVARPGNPATMKPLTVFIFIIERLTRSSGRKGGTLEKCCHPE